MAQAQEFNLSERVENYEKFCELHGFFEDNEFCDEWNVLKQNIEKLMEIERE